MAITIGSPNLSNWKHLRARYVAAAGALAIAAGALVAAAPWQDSSAPNPAAAASIAPTSFYRTAEPREQIFYLVGSQSEADSLKGTIAAEGGTAGLNQDLSVVVVDTPAMEASVNLIGSELTPLGINYQIIDLRGR
jgi:hypothetical protein